MTRRTKKGSLEQKATVPRVTAGRLAPWVLMGLSVMAGGLSLGHWAKRSSRFAVHSIEVEGNRRAETAELLALSELRRGMNIFALDASRAARAMEVHPWIRRAEVVRHIPGRLRVFVEEHEPIGLVALEYLYYVDRDARVVKRYAPGEAERLAIVTGLSREPFEHGDAQEHARLRKAVSFLLALKEARGTRDVAALTASEVYVHPVQGVSFVDQNGASITMGDGPWPPKLLRLEQVQHALAVDGTAASEISLVGGHRADRVVARLKGR